MSAPKASRRREVTISLEDLPEVPEGAALLVFLDVDVRACRRCGERIQRGEVVRMRRIGNGDELAHPHDCLAPALVAIDGGGQTSTPTPPLLAVVANEHEATR